MAENSNSRFDLSESGANWVLENFPEHYLLFFPRLMSKAIISIGIHENEVVNIMKQGNDYGNGGRRMKKRSADLHNSKLSNND